MHDSDDDLPLRMKIVMALCDSRSQLGIHLPVSATPARYVLQVRSSEAFLISILGNQATQCEIQR